VETRYEIRGDGFTVRTSGTQRQHTLACRKAVAVKLGEVREAWLAEIDAELQPLLRPERYQDPRTRAYRKERVSRLKWLRRKVASKTFLA
jgi:hypothetical protein